MDDDQHKDAACSFCDTPKDKLPHFKILVFVRERFYICTDCVEEAQGAIDGHWEIVWRDQGEVEYESWFPSEE